MDFFRKNELVPISTREFEENANTKYGIPMNIQMKLLNGNA